MPPRQRRKGASGPAPPDPDRNPGGTASPAPQHRPTRTHRSTPAPDGGGATIRRSTPGGAPVSPLRRQVVDAGYAAFPIGYRRYHAESRPFVWDCPTPGAVRTACSNLHGGMTMDLRAYLRILRQRWLIIVICTLCGVAAAALYVLASTPKFASTARLFISTPTSDATTQAYQGGLFSQQRVTSYADP